MKPFISGAILGLMITWLADNLQQHLIAICMAGIAVGLLIWEDL